MRLSVYFRYTICALDRPLSPLLRGGPRQGDGVPHGSQPWDGAYRRRAAGGGVSSHVATRRHADAYAKFQRVQTVLTPEEQNKRNQEFDLLCRLRGYPRATLSR